jgi:16S rRNA (adenine1518-N6/adenine1519-N6)-dimethyltransferase
MEAVGVALASVPNARFKLVANLPYNIATPVLSNLLLAEHVPVRMVATIQKELAERIVAAPWTKDYSALSVWMQSNCQCEIVRYMPPSVFWPAPKVDSAIIRLTLDPARRAAIPSLRYFHQFVKSIFLHRRKYLRANVTSALKHHATKEQVDEILNAMQFSADARTEQLSIEQLLELTERVRALAPEWKL